MIGFLFSLVPSQAREYVESLHQNQKDVLIYGKNNVKVAPKDKDTFLAGYLSFHQIITHLGNVSGQQQETTLVLKWTPNQLMNGHTTQEKSASWQQALYIDLKTILFIHCHQVNTIKHYLTLLKNYLKCLILIFEFWHFPPIFVPLKSTCLVTLFGFQKLARIDHFWHL